LVKKQNRMNFSLFGIAAQVRAFIQESELPIRSPFPTASSSEAEFNDLALKLFAAQFESNKPYQKFCQARNVDPKNVRHWSEIPAMPTAAFKEFEVTCLLPAQRTAVFYSSGTTGTQPSRHFHSADSLSVYEASLARNFDSHVLADFQRLEMSSRGSERKLADKQGRAVCPFRLLILTPPPAQAVNSSLVYMFETIRRAWLAPESVYAGLITGDGDWTLDFEAACNALANDTAPLIILGTAFSFVHLLERLANQGMRLRLPSGSRALETGGYKGRSRALPKAELHELITLHLGIPSDQIVCEYGMSELSSQAYDRMVGHNGKTSADVEFKTQSFRFPPWARVQLVSPETGREPDKGQAGMIRIFDLANVYSVMAIQTEDLGIRREDSFELLGRVAFAEPRGCSLMTA
jgi:hypothetical protein